MPTERHTICIVGLGYVGLPLAHVFARAGYDVHGFDIDASRIEELKTGTDRTNELTPAELGAVTIHYTTDASAIGQADIVILAIPTPVDEHNLPDLTLVEKASETVGKHMKKGAIVVYESTVYPGVTEELCAPILEKASGMTWKKDFHLGYSPERVNPGDKQHTIDRIKKIVAGDDEATLQTLVELYGSIVTAGIHQAPSIKVAEMAKAIENAQRDLNIAYVNEIAMLCNKLNIASKDVFAAAKTKWNFLPFSPGLVGGHCIGVDPYYLVEKARMLGMKTHVITAGRAVNDDVSRFVAKQVQDALGKRNKDARILVLGLTFKEDIPDMRNSKSLDVCRYLSEAGYAVEVHDPMVGPAHMERLHLKAGTPANDTYDAVVLLVPHRQYRESMEAIISAAKADGVVYDLKSILDREAVRASGRTYLAL